MLWFYQQLSVHGWNAAFLLYVRRLCGAIEESLGHFRPHWLKSGWQSGIRQGIILSNTPPKLGIECGPRRGQRRRGQTARYRYSFSRWAIMTNAMEDGKSNSMDSKEWLHMNSPIARVPTSTWWQVEPYTTHYTHAHIIILRWERQLFSSVAASTQQLEKMCKHRNRTTHGSLIDLPMIHAGQVALTGTFCGV